MTSFWIHIYGIGNYVETLPKKTKKQKEGKPNGYIKRNVAAVEQWEFQWVIAYLFTNWATREAQNPT